MNRKPLALLLLVVVCIAIGLMGCQKKKEILAVPPVNYAPASLIAYPDTVNVTLKWTLNTEAESKTFGGYYVYCTRRDSGLMHLPAESLRVFQVGSPLPAGTSSIVVTADPRTGQKLIQGTRYQFYVRSMVDNELSWATMDISSPRPEGDAVVYGWVPASRSYPYEYAGPITGPRCDSAYFSAFQFDTAASVVANDFHTVSRYSLHRFRIKWWDYTVLPQVLIDSTEPWVMNGLYWQKPDYYKIYWKDVGQTIRDTDLIFTARGQIPDTNVVRLCDFLAEMMPDNRLRLAGPKWTVMPDTMAWQKVARETSFMELANWNISKPVPVQGDSIGSIYITAASVGKVYQLFLNDYNYAKIRIDEVTAYGGNTIKLKFHFALQRVPDVRSF